MAQTGQSTKVGPYTLLAKIGAGGMGVVHLAEDMAGRRVAIKILRPHIVGDDHGRARMAREVTSLRRVRSPRVAEVYDADPWGETPYLVTRYVPGPSLHQYVDEHGPMRGDDLLALARGLAAALVAVHAADVLHRDVKPSNVLIEGRNPVLIDFGLAQLSDDSRLTSIGWLVGTPGYLAPEILYGDEPTPRADMHAWAATVVFAATGRGPYGSGPAVAVMDRVRRGEHDLTGVPDALYWMVRRCLMPDPLDRPGAAELLGWLTWTLRAGDPGGVSDARTTLSPVPRRPSAVATPPTAVTVPSAPMVDPGSPKPQRAPRVAAVLFWLAVLMVVLAGAVTAPVVAAAGLFCVAWLLRTGHVRATALAGWRNLRGPRRSDGVLATVCLPWFAVVALPAAIANVAVAVINAALVVVVASVVAPPKSLVPVLLLGGVVAAVCVWCGPASLPVRSAGRGVSGALLRPRLQAVLVTVVVLAAAGGLVVVRQVSGPVYGPLPSPPWQQTLKDLVP